MPPIVPPPVQDVLVARSGVKLIDPNGNSVPVIEATFRNQINVGCTWNATIGAEIDLHSLSDSGAWHLVWADPQGGTSWTSPALALTHGARTVGRATQISGVDMLTYTLSTTSALCPYSYNADSLTTISGIGTLAGVTILYNGGCPRCQLEQFPYDTSGRLDTETKGGAMAYVPKYPGNAESLGSLLAKLCNDTGCEFRVNNAHIEILPMGYEQTPSRTIVIRKSDLTVNRSTYFNQVILAKIGKDTTTHVFDATGGGVQTASLLDRYGNGLRFPRAIPVVVSGGIGYVKFLDNSNPPQVCGYQRFANDAPDVPVTSYNPAINIEWESRAAGGGPTFVRIRVEGAPSGSYAPYPTMNQPWLPSGSYTYGWAVSYPETVTLTTPRVQRKVLTSPYWDNDAIARTIAPSLLQQYNKDRNGVTHTCILDPKATFGLPGFRIPGDSATPPMRVESIEMSDGPGGRQMVLSGYVTT